MKMKQTNAKSMKYKCWFDLTEENMSNIMNMSCFIYDIFSYLSYPFCVNGRKEHLTIKETKNNLHPFRDRLKGCLSSAKDEKMMTNERK